MSTLELALAIAGAIYIFFMIAVGVEYFTDKGGGNASKEGTPVRILNGVSEQKKRKTVKKEVPPAPEKPEKKARKPKVQPPAEWAERVYE